MSTGGTPWQAGDDSAGDDTDVEWAFFGAHDIEYWVLRDGRLVPAEGSELERIAEWERERTALPRLRRWEQESERERETARLPFAVVRFASWCGGLVRRVVRVRPRVRVLAASPRMTASNDEGERAERRRSDVARR